MHDATSMRTHFVHHRSTPAKSRYGVTIAHGFGITGEVCINAVERLRATFGDPKPRFNFIDDEHGAVLGTQITQALKPRRCC